jgi:DNA/RNA-binding domain of Phe-tRNA-synthetase-like protein
MLQIDPAVLKTWPGAQMGVLAMRRVDAKAPPDPASVSRAMEEIKSLYAHLDRAALKAVHPVKAYVDYYRKFGYSYHVLGQLESVLSGKRTVDAGSGLLSAMFLSELESMILTAGHDLDALKTPLTLRLSTGEERFESISGKEATTVAGDLMVASGDSVISSILRGPDAASRITGATTGVLFTLYAPPGVEKGVVESALHKLEERIRAVSPGCETLDLAVYPVV